MDTPLARIQIQNHAPYSPFATNKCTPVAASELKYFKAFLSCIFALSGYDRSEWYFLRHYANLNQLGIKPTITVVV